MEKECALVRRAQSCSSDIIVTKKAERDNEIEIWEKYIFLIALLLHNYRLRYYVKKIVRRYIPIRAK